MLAWFFACAAPEVSDRSPAPDPSTPAPVPDTTPDPTSAPASTTPIDTGCDAPFVALEPYDPDGELLCDIPEGYVASGGDPADPPCRLGVGGASDRDPDDVSATLSVATWNVEYGVAAAEVLDALATDLAGLDFLLLEEVSRHDGESNPADIDQVEEIAAVTGMSFAYLVGWDRREDPALGGEHGVAVLSKYPLGNASALRLPALNDWWEEDGVYGGRVALGVDVLVGCTPIRLYAMHLDTRGLGDDGRARQGAVVRADADASGTALQIAGGDWNTWTCNPLIADCGARPAAEEVVTDFLDDGWQDAVPDDRGWTQLGEGVFPQRLDWLFHRGGLVPVDGEIARSVEASDHVPVVFRFSLP